MQRSNELDTICSNAMQKQITAISFEKQFSAKEYLQTPFGVVETVDIIPAELTHTKPVLLASGWGETLELQKECLKEIYTSGRRVIALRHAVLIKKGEERNTVSNCRTTKGRNASTVATTKGYQRS